MQWMVPESPHCTSQKLRGYLPKTHLLLSPSTLHPTRNPRQSNGTSLMWPQLAPSSHFYVHWLCWVLSHLLPKVSPLSPSSPGSSLPIAPPKTSFKEFKWARTLFNFKPFLPSWGHEVKCSPNRPYDVWVEPSAPLPTKHLLFLRCANKEGLETHFRKSARNLSMSSLESLLLSCL